jgi:hypothetical protein
MIDEFIPQVIRYLYNRGYLAVQKMRTAAHKANRKQKKQSALRFSYRIGLLLTILTNSHDTQLNRVLATYISLEQAATFCFR